MVRELQLWEAVRGDRVHLTKPSGVIVSLFLLESCSGYHTLWLSGPVVLVLHHGAAMLSLKN